MTQGRKGHLNFMQTRPSCLLGSTINWQNDVYITVSRIVCDLNNVGKLVRSESSKVFGCRSKLRRLIALDFTGNILYGLGVTFGFHYVHIGCTVGTKI